MSNVIMSSRQMTRLKERRALLGRDCCRYMFNYEHWLYRSICLSEPCKGQAGTSRLVHCPVREKENERLGRFLTRENAKRVRVLSGSYLRHHKISAPKARIICS